MNSREIVGSSGGPLEEAFRRPLPSSIALIISNLVPLGLVVFHRLDVFAVMFLFWLENVVVGAFNVLRMVKASGKTSAPLEKLFLIPFFCVHYGLFTLVHGVFVVTLFGLYEVTGRMVGQFTNQEVAQVFALVLGKLPSIGAALAGLAISHGVSFYSNYIGRGEFRRVSPGELMARPYARVVILHLTIILGGLAVMKTGETGVAVAMLVILKAVMDLLAHWVERRKFAGASGGQGPGPAGQTGNAE